MAIKPIISALLLLWVGGFGLTSFAQTPEPDDQIICVGGLLIWLPSPQETRAIQSQPIPESFSWPSGDPCGHGPSFDDLMRWHLSFGTEGSSLAAVDVF